jgi:hypothetical protein
MAYATLRYQQTLTMTACLLTLLLSIPCSLFPIPYSLSSQITFMAYATLRHATLSANPNYDSLSFDTVAINRENTY